MKSASIIVEDKKASVQSSAPIQKANDTAEFEPDDEKIVTKKK